VAPTTCPDLLRVVIEMIETEAACPSCGVFSGRIKERPQRRIKDLPASGQQVQLWWRKRRLKCVEEGCRTKSFTQTSLAILPGSGMTDRLLEKVALSIAKSNRSISDVCREYGVSWTTGNTALTAAVEQWLPEPEPTKVLGIDETRARSVKWVFEDKGHRSNPWMTSFVNADPSCPGGLLGLTPGRSGGCVGDWLGQQSQEFLDGIEVVVIDPSAPYAAGIRLALPDAEIAVDHWHIIKLGNKMVTDTRRRVIQQSQGRRGRKVDAMWAHRMLLLTAEENLSPKQRKRLNKVLDSEDSTGEIKAAYECKEHLRKLLSTPYDHRLIRKRLFAFYSACADANTVETIKLAKTIQTWWKPILVFLELRVTNARTEGFNRIIKQVKRTGCGYRNMDNYEKRIIGHIALNRAA
jgi:transposase